MKLRELLKELDGNGVLKMGYETALGWFDESKVYFNNHQFIYGSGIPERVLNKEIETMISYPTSERGMNVEYKIVLN